MKNLDLVQEERNGILQKMNKAITENNTEAYQEAFNELASSIQQVVLSKYEQAVQSNDSNVLAQRGLRQLTSEENKYYNAQIGRAHV